MKRVIAVILGVVCGGLVGFAFLFAATLAIGTWFASSGGGGGGAAVIYLVVFPHVVILGAVVGGLVATVRRGRIGTRIVFGLIGLGIMVFTLLLLVSAAPDFFIEWDPWAWWFR